MKDYSNKANDVNLNIKLPKELRDDFRTYCDKNALNLSMVIRLFMVDTLNKNENQLKD